jgi:hypothetical protein
MAVVGAARSVRRNCYGRLSCGALGLRDSGQRGEGHRSVAGVGELHGGAEDGSLRRVARTGAARLSIHDIEVLMVRRTGLRAQLRASAGGGERGTPVLPSAPPREILAVRTNSWGMVRWDGRASRCGVTSPRGVSVLCPSYRISPWRTARSASAAPALPSTVIVAQRRAGVRTDPAKPIGLRSRQRTHAVAHSGDGVQAGRTEDRCGPS